MTFINPKSPAAVLFLTDGYKLDHRRQYPEGTEYVYSNFTNRGSRVPGINHVVHFGLQAFLRDVLMDGFETFFAATEDEVAADYEAKLLAFLGPNDIGSDHIRDLHRLGYVPLRFSAVPEGTPVPLRVPSFVFENTDPKFFWVTNYIETVLSSYIWQPATSATTAWNFRRVLEDAAEKTAPGTDVSFLAHDFSFRGMAGPAAAAASGAGHLLSFTGSDSLASIDWVDYFYPGEDNGFIAGGVPATEHSVMMAGIAHGSEEETFNRLLDLYPVGLLSVVSDTDDYFKVLTDILPALKGRIMERPGKLVIRPDSGDPTDIICGTIPATGLLPDGTPEQRGSIELLWEVFGGTVNEQGYKVLDEHIGLLYGDSITPERAKTINARLESKGFASINWVAGIGSFSYQYVTRDTFASAIKATWVQINGEGFGIKKAPKTDNGTKNSAKGRLALNVGYDGNLDLIQEATPEDEENSLMQPVWENGQFLRFQSFKNVRETLISETEDLKQLGLI